MAAMNKFNRIRNVDMEMLMEDNAANLQGDVEQKKNSVMTFLAIELNLKATGRRWDRLCTLRKGEHLWLVNGTKDTFSIQFIGENHQEFARQLVITDERYAKALRQILNNTEENEYLFTRYSDFKRYLTELSPLLQSKDFRTYNANIRTQFLLNAVELTSYWDLTNEMKIFWARRVFNQVVITVAHMLNVQNQDVKKYHIDPRIIASWCKYRLRLDRDDAQKVSGLANLQWGFLEIYVNLRNTNTPFFF